MFYWLWALTFLVRHVRHGGAVAPGASAEEVVREGAAVPEEPGEGESESEAAAAALPLSFSVSPPPESSNPGRKLLHGTLNNFRPWGCSPQGHGPWAERPLFSAEQERSGTLWGGTLHGRSR